MDSKFKLTYEFTKNKLSLFTCFICILSILLIALQYAVPGLIFAWAYDRSDSIWIPIAAHAAVNALAVWTFYA